jgi:hypothetical protein
MLHIRMRGDIDKLRVPGDFDEFVAGVNIASAKGLQYLIMEGENGNMMALNQHNILTVEQVDDGDEDDLYGG